MNIKRENEIKQNNDIKEARQKQALNKFLRKKNIQVINNSLYYI